MKKKKKPLMVFILGPTGVGKSEFAVKLAKKIGGEIISCDSMQVYKGMPVISQQPRARLLKIIPHHLIGLLAPSREWSAADFIEKALESAKNIVRRKHVPIIVGGTGLYAHVFLKGLFPSPPKDEKFRKRLCEEAKKRGNEKLYKRLLKIDPLYASKIHSNDLRRVVRALEVYKLTGKPISEQHKKSKGIEDEYRAQVFILNRRREELYKRINERVEEMFADGIIEEVKRLRRCKVSHTAKAALGYKEVNDYIDEDYNLEETKERLRRNTRHYAKRQLTWFRKEKDATWFNLGTTRKNTSTLSMIVKKTRNY